MDWSEPVSIKNKEDTVESKSFTGIMGNPRVLIEYAIGMFMERKIKVSFSK